MGRGQKVDPALDVLSNEQLTPLSDLFLRYSAADRFLRDMRLADFSLAETTG
jgi:hypothetical protein